MDSAGNGNYRRLLSSQMLFTKKLSTADVIKSLVIPTKYAKKHFPDLSAAPSGEILLDFAAAADAQNIHRLRYAQWKCGRHVVTTGWMRLVKEQSFVPGDVVEFHRCRRREIDGRIMLLFVIRKKGAAAPRKKLTLFGWDIY